MRELDYQALLISKIRDLLPGCFVIKPDPQQIQGFPDLLILYRRRWGALEVKRTKSSPFRPNQEYYLEELGKAAYASVIHPDNEQEVLEELLRSLRSSR